VGIDRPDDAEVPRDKLSDHPADRARADTRHRQEYDADLRATAPMQKRTEPVGRSEPGARSKPGGQTENGQLAQHGSSWPRHTCHTGQIGYGSRPSGHIPGVTRSGGSEQAQPSGACGPQAPHYGAGGTRTPAGGRWRLGLGAHRPRKAGPGAHAPQSATPHPREKRHPTRKIQHGATSIDCRGT